MPSRVRNVHINYQQQLVKIWTTEVSQALSWDGSMSEATHRAPVSQFRVGKLVLPCGTGQQGWQDPPGIAQLGLLLKWLFRHVSPACSPETRLLIALAALSSPITTETFSPCSEPEDLILLPFPGPTLPQAPLHAPAARAHNAEITLCRLWGTEYSGD